MRASTPATGSGRGPLPRRLGVAGVTLIESMVVLSLVGLSSVAVVPGLRNFVATQQVKAVATDLAADLLLARSEALKRNRSVALVPNRDGWRSGWRVQAEGADIARRDTSPSARFDNAPASIAFNGYGRLAEPATAVRWVIDTADVAADIAQRCMELDPSGRVRISVGRCP